MSIAQPGQPVKPNRLQPGFFVSAYSVAHTLAARIVVESQPRLVENISRVEYRRMWEELLRALCLLLVLEGILPFLYPARWRRMIATIATIDDKTLRIIGLISMAVGVALLYLLR